MKAVGRVLVVEILGIAKDTIWISFPTVDAILEGTAEEREHVFMVSDDEKLMISIWECTPCKEKVTDYPVDEFVTVLAGSVTLTSEDGEVEIYNAGDSFVTPRGWSGEWHMTEQFRGHFVMYAP